MVSILGLIAIVIGIFSVVVLISIYRGFVLSILWGWFVVPVFGIAPLTIPVAIGLSILIGLFTHKPTIKGNDKESTTYSVTYSLVTPLLALLIGYIVKQFM